MNRKCCSDKLVVSSLQNNLLSHCWWAHRGPVPPTLSWQSTQGRTTTTWWLHCGRPLWTRWTQRQCWSDEGENRITLCGNTRSTHKNLSQTTTPVQQTGYFWQTWTKCYFYPIVAVAAAVVFWFYCCCPNRLFLMVPALTHGITTETWCWGTFDSSSSWQWCKEKIE